MNENFWIEFLNKRMQQMGVLSFYYEPMSLYVEPTAKSFRVDNGFVYLVGNPSSIEIESDTSFYIGSDRGQAENPTPEFSGLISYRTATGFDTPQLIRLVRIHIQSTTKTILCHESATSRR